MKTGNPLNFICSFCEEMIPGHGEDSFCYSFCDDAGLLAVFDGCGGAGAREHDYYSHHTEAYMASRLCAGVFFDSFRSAYPGSLSPTQFVAEWLSPVTAECLGRFQPPKDETGFRIKGSMVRTLPTTAAAALVQMGKKELMVSAIWAGDSRVFILDERGLAQLTVDDTSVPDPMENLYEDGILQNILSCDKTIKLHCHAVRMQAPFMVLAATDGCFGYVSTPMEFEGLVLETLLTSDCAAQWEERLKNAVAAYAGDDHTLCLAAFGYSDFRILQNSVRGRYALLKEQYLDRIRSLPMEDRQSRRKLWNRYANGYCRYIKDGQV